MKLWQLLNPSYLISNNNLKNLSSSVSCSSWMSSVCEAGTKVLQPFYCTGVLINTVVDWNFRTLAFKLKLLTDHWTVKVSFALQMIAPIVWETVGAYLSSWGQFLSISNPLCGRWTDKIESSFHYDLLIFIHSLFDHSSSISKHFKN